MQIHLLALDENLHATVSRRSPEADPATRTIHVEVDLPDPKHRIPVDTTAELLAGAGSAVPATKIPLVAADLSQDKATLFTVIDSIAHRQTLPVLGEAGGELFLDPQLLPDGAEVVLEGRATLNDKDRVHAKEADLTVGENTRRAPPGPAAQHRGPGRGPGRHQGRG